MTLGINQQTSSANLSCTPTTAGALTCSTAPADGQALADGVFVGQTVTNANLGTSPATVTQPVGVTGAGTSTTQIVLSSVSAGQFAKGEWVTYPSEPAGTNMFISGGSGTGGAGTYTISCNGTRPNIGTGVTVTASAIGVLNTSTAGQLSTTVNTVTISTNATSGTASAATTTFNHNYIGGSDTVTVTAGNPLPTYQVTFTPSDFASLNSNTAIYFRAKAYPVTGDNALDSQSVTSSPPTPNAQSGIGTIAGGTALDAQGCDWFWNNAGVTGAGTCNSSNAAWFANSGLGASHAQVSPNFHNLWAYYDTNASYAPLYVWIDGAGTCGANSCIYSSASDPGSGHYFASAFAAISFIKNCNQNNSGCSNSGGTSTRVTTHNDINGVVFCYLAAASPISGFGGSIFGSVTEKVPGVTVTSAKSGGTCPGPNVSGVYALGGDPTNVHFEHNATATNTEIGPNFHINNMMIGDTGQVFEGNDAVNTTTFPTIFAIFENDIIQPLSASAQLYRIGETFIYNSYVDEAGFEGGVMAPSKESNTNAVQSFASTLICSTASTITTGKAYDLYNSLGDDMFGCNPQYPQQVPPYGTQGLVPLQRILAYDKIMGAGAAVNLTCNEGGRNMLLVNNVIERGNNTGLGSGFQVSADGCNVPLINGVREYNTTVGSRTSIDFVEGQTITPVTATGGSLSNSTSYTVQIAYALANATTTISSIDNAATVATNGSGTAFTLQLPCDPNYVFYIGFDTNANNPPLHYATVSGADAKALAGCRTVTVTAIGGSATLPTYVATEPAHNEPKWQWTSRFNIDYQRTYQTDTSAQAPIIGNGARIGDWEGFYGVSNIGEITVAGAPIGSTWQAVSGLGQEQCNLCANGSAGVTTNISFVSYSDDRSWGGSTTDSNSYPALNIFEGNYCPNTAVTNAASAVPSGLAAFPYDIQGNPRKNDGTGSAGAYEAGCH
jgi:hypothetical protein